MKIVIGALLLASGCASVEALDAAADAGPTQPEVASVEPPAGDAPPSATFTVHFSEPMDEGPLLAASGRSETVVLAAEADVERAAAAIEHSSLSAHERELLVAAAAEVGPDRKSLRLTPDQPLPAGRFYLLVSPRLKDDHGRKLAGNGARFLYRIGAGLSRPKLIRPQAGSEVPLNISSIRALAERGRLSLLGPEGAAVASAEAAGETLLKLSAPLRAGAKYVLALDGSAEDAQSFTAASCARTAPPSLQGGKAQITSRDDAALALAVLDWPALVRVEVSDATGATVSAQTQIDCAPPACGPQSFVCSGSVRIGGLKAASDYTLQVSAQDDFGFSLRGPEQKFSTLSPLPRVLISEVMTAPPAGEYVELLNLGPGAADPVALALRGPDGTARPLLAQKPALPLQLAPGARALAVGASFDASLYPHLPLGTPILRASTQRLLGRGLNHAAPQAFQLVLQGEIPVEISDFPGGGPHCPSGASLQRDETAPIEGPASWSCGKVGGTPGTGP